MAVFVAAEVVRSLELETIQFQAEITQAEKDLSRVRHRLASLNRRRTFLTFAIFARKVVDETIVWRPGAILVVVTAVGGGAFAVTRSPFCGVAVGAFTSMAMVALMLYPPDSLASESLLRSNSEKPDLQSKQAEIESKLQGLQAALLTASESLKDERRKLVYEEMVASSEYRRKMLLAENWKAMRSVEFEKYLERVFAELGYSVETTKVTGDQGVDLIVVFNGRRIAIQVKGYENSVSNGAVQEAHAGKDYYGCDASSVITNSLFTKSAIDLASKVGCILIDEVLLPNVVMGKIDLWSMCFERSN